MNNTTTFSGKKVGAFGGLGKTGAALLLTSLGIGGLTLAQKLKDMKKEEPPTDEVTLPIKVEYKRIKRRI